MCPLILHHLLWDDVCLWQSQQKPLCCITLADGRSPTTRISRLDSFLCVYVLFFQLSVLPVISLVDGSVHLPGLSVSEFSTYVSQLASPFLVGMVILQ